MERKTARQSGMVLATGLIMLLVLTVIGVTAISSSTMQERMAFNSGKRDIIFECAERTLDFGERQVIELSNDELKTIVLNGNVINDDQDRLPDPGLASWSGEQSDFTVSEEDPCHDFDLAYALYWKKTTAGEGSGSGGSGSENLDGSVMLDEFADAPDFGGVATEDDTGGEGGEDDPGPGSISNKRIDYGWYYVFARANATEGQGVVLQSTIWRRQDSE